MGTMYRWYKQSQIGILTLEDVSCPGRQLDAVTPENVENQSVNIFITDDETWLYEVGSISNLVYILKKSVSEICIAADKVSFL